MNNSIDKVAKLLMYKGPKISDLIAKTVNEKKQFTIDKLDNLLCLTIKFNTAYNVHVQDKYIFNSFDEIIKQTLIINNKEKIVFDKYHEAKEILLFATESKVMVS
jgi:hypothetical protein